MRDIRLSEMYDWSALTSNPIPPPIHILQTQNAMVKEENNILKIVLGTACILGLVFILSEYVKFLNKQKIKKSILENPPLIKTSNARNN